MDKNINQILDSALPGADITLPSGEFEGPVIITKPLRISGKNTTVWAKKGKVIEIKSHGVTIENLRAELTETDESDIAVKTDFPAEVKNVEVLGSVSGFGSEDGYFDVPRTIELGEFASDAENTFSLSVNVPEKTEIICGIRELSFTPNVLHSGRNDLTITVSGISDKTLLYAEVLFKTRFIRRIYLTGKPGNIPAVKNKCVYTAPERDFSQAPQALLKEQTAPTDVISFDLRQDSTLSALEMQKGQRVSLTKYCGSQFKIFFTCEKPQQMEIDPYIFLLGENDKAPGDEYLVFFGNESSPNGEIKYFPHDGHIETDISKTDYRVKKIALTYAIYAGNENNCFSSVKNARISIRTDSERLSFVMNGLTSETAVIALEFYLYKGEWKISAVGSGFKDGMARLCNHYGIQVIE